MVGREMRVLLPGRETSYDIIVEPGLRRKLGERLKELAAGQRVVVVSDTRVAGLYGQEVMEALAPVGGKARLITIEPGERQKTWRTVVRLAEELLAGGADRQTWLVALGGGVVGDLTGFLASIYLRGVPVVQVPTTLLAMVDAAIGGKTGVDLPQGKNLLGTFHQPRLVAIDPDFLVTLALRQRRSGLAEVVKTAFIRDAGLLADLKEHGPGLFRDRGLKDRARLADIISRAAAIKAQVVAADEREGGLRRILNFGHTLGHAVETASGYRMAHGEAVAVGMGAALDLSVALTGLSPGAAREGKELMRALGLPLKPPRLAREAVRAALRVDKKRVADRLVFVLLKKLGEAVVVPEVPMARIDAWLEKNMD